MSDPLSEAARIMGRKGGSAKSEAKTRAVHANAKLPRPNAKGKPKRKPARCPTCGRAIRKPGPFPGTLGDPNLYCSKNCVFKTSWLPESEKA